MNPYHGRTTRTTLACSIRSCSFIPRGFPPCGRNSSYYNNVRLLARVEVLRIGGDEAKPWPALIHANAMEANFVLSHCHNLRQLWVRNLHLVEFEAAKAPTLGSLMYIVNCQVTTSILKTLTHEVFPSLSALAFGSNWLQSPRRAHFVDDSTIRISLAHLDRSIFAQLTCLSAGDELGQVLLLTPRLVLLDCWRTALVSSRVVKSLPTSVRFLRLCESTEGDASLEEEEGLEEEEEEEAEAETSEHEVEGINGNYTLASNGLQIGDQQQVGEASGTHSEEEPLSEGLSPARKRMAALVRRIQSPNGFKMLSELHVPELWEGVLYKDLAAATKRRGGKIVWESEEERSGFDLAYW
ncbi:BQ2448_7775 [Microbotryum intermedium]|uniref:BQ2448_7775 protein n=1 Tax=Microbotryum intermedium TaxID=269621 RepID=A0A238FUK3_9BASI|nr:BQ2448_7775 [Microbotryum intermedium]